MKKYSVENQQLDIAGMTPARATEVSYQHFATLVKTIVYNGFRDKDTVRDVEQEVFLSLFRHLSEKDAEPIINIEAYLVRVTFNKIKDFRRRSQALERVPEGGFIEGENKEGAMLSAPSRRISQETDFSNKELWARLSSALDAEEKRMLELMYMEGFTPQEVGAMMGISNENTVKIRIFRAKEKIHKNEHRLLNGHASPDVPTKNHIDWGKINGTYDKWKAGFANDRRASQYLPTIEEALNPQERDLLAIYSMGKSTGEITETLGDNSARGLFNNLTLIREKISANRHGSGTDPDQVPPMREWLDSVRKDAGGTVRQRYRPKMNPPMTASGGYGR